MGYTLEAARGYRRARGSQPRQPVGIAGEGFGQDLDSYFPLEFRVTGTIDLAHATRT